jgi:hemerythrin-like domain-containing protein
MNSNPSPLQLHASPAAGVDQPFEMLAACHERVERMLALLARLCAHLGAQGVDAQAQQAAIDVMRYFDLAAPHHHEDEERHLFPRLRQAGHADLVDRLQQDHVAMGRAWAVLRIELDAIAGADWVRQRLAAFGATCADFDTLYRGHLGAEDGQAFPLARPLVDSDALRAMSDDMARRRGLR